MRHPIAPLCAAALLLFASPIAAAEAAANVSPSGESDPGLWALELGVPDLARAVAFYTSALGFEVVATEPAGTWTLLGNGDARLALAASSLPVAAAGGARAYANYSIGDLDVAGQAVVRAGGDVGEPFDSPVGRAVRIVDPFGHPGYLIDHPWDEMAAEATPEVFNVALGVREVEAAERFYTALGFAVRTRDYLPQTLVFEPRGAAQLILHPTAERDAGPASEAGALLLAADPGRALGALASLGAIVERTTPAISHRWNESPAAGSTVEIRDPSGILLKLARRAPAESAIADVAGEQLSAEQAAAAFERLKSLAGEWQAKSSKGWDEPVTYGLVAGGSVVVESNSFKDAPHDVSLVRLRRNTMFTMFHLDGERLLATHYCASGNQPRLIASGVSDDGRELTFTYLDATGLPSRDHGHMDQAVFRFLAPDRFIARWTWYQKGAEQWLEEIEHRRVGAVVRAAVSP